MVVHIGGQIEIDGAKPYPCPRDDLAGHFLLTFTLSQGNFCANLARILRESFFCDIILL